MNKPITKVMTQTTGGHNKFWCITCDDQTKTATVRWGRIGTNGQTQIKHFSSGYDLRSFEVSKCSEKLSGGYNYTTEEVLKQKATEAAIVGTQNKCVSFHWVKLRRLITTPPACDIVAITDDQLADPTIEPAMAVCVNTRKEIGGQKTFHLLFTGDGTFLIHRPPMSSAITVTLDRQVVKGHDLYQLVEKVEAAVGSNVTSAGYSN